MKIGVVILLLALGSVSLYAQNNEARDALLGNSPSTTLTTGIGQVVKPVGTPVVQSPLSIHPPSEQPKPLLPLTAPKAPEEKGPLEAEKIEGKYELGEVPQKEKKAENKNYPILSDRTANAGSMTYSKPRTAPVIRIPYSRLPSVQKVPPQQ